jgi:hypothetical protein
MEYMQRGAEKDTDLTENRNRRHRAKQLHDLTSYMGLRKQFNLSPVLDHTLTVFLTLPLADPPGGTSIPSELQ